MVDLSELSVEAKRNVKEWLDGPYDIDTKRSIQEMQVSNIEQLENAFYTHLAFGTGGMRGLMGIGPNRMNVYTVRQTTRGLADYLRLQYEDKPLRVAIGYDSRNNSQLFAMEAARVLAAASIESYLFRHLRPTPLVSFVCRHLHCDAGIMITASHNPPEYNGYKVYWNTGGQILSPHEKGVLTEIHRVRQSGVVPVSDEQDPYIHLLGPETDDAYFEAIRPLSLWPKQDKSSLHVVYSCLHGTGGTVVPQALAQIGVSSLSLVKAQMIPDGSFPTTRTPNPEVAEAMRLGTEQMIAEGADLFLATDPDADRLGLVVNHQGIARPLTGNQVALIAVEYLFRQLSNRAILPAHSVVVKTIVTTPLIRTIAEKWGGECLDVLTGFKYIAQKIDELEADPESGHFLFGCEESIGYLYGTHVRDKDGVVSACLMAEIAWYLKTQGKTLVDALEEIWKTYGYYEETLLNCPFGETKVGRDRMASAMKRLRENPPKSFEEFDIVAQEDLLTKKFQGDPRFRVGADLPAADVVLFTILDGSTIVVRPSGTEPKIKVYFMMRAPVGETLEKSRVLLAERSDRLRTSVKELFDSTK